MPGVQWHPSDSIINVLRAAECPGRAGGDSVAGRHQGLYWLPVRLMVIFFVQI